MNDQRTREIAEAAVGARGREARGCADRMKRARFGDVGIVSINVKPGFDHEEAPWRT